ncbi:hypothetical protein H6F44_06360 [Pseudanabaena sp. FACHB-1277]|uniref:PEP-CTERM sorting domain-containing protein n=1 Tax=Pseudanabaena cinerea FACHB-1277 TaxID=2949581 RepID=A0A926Z7D5_9CYAN|nr:choice-of-anchor R domain-containing protein [Pseudanabaena cinerea]MBD2149749.1 hypothetical protein [Pseudanabaena cinerea FACHB-1277]
MLTALNSIPAKVCIAALCTSAVSISVLTDSANAISLIGNLDGTNGTASLIDTDRTLTVQFTTPNLPTANDKFQLNNIRLRVSNFRTNSTAPSADKVLLSITDNANGNSFFGDDLFTTFSSPTSTVNTPRTITFTPSSTFFFERNTTYWLSVAAFDSGTTFNWISNAANTAPTGGLASLGAGGYKYTVDAGGDGFTAAVPSFGSFDVDVTQVPFEFEASGGLVILGGLFLARRLKARKKDNNVA